MMTRVSLILAIIATVGLVALGATSLDAAVRRMGASGWQRLHNTIYVITALALIHYLLSPDTYPEQFLTSGIFFWLVIWRMLNRRGLGTDARVLAVLAIASGAVHGAARGGMDLGLSRRRTALDARHEFQPRPRPRAGLEGARARTCGRAGRCGHAVGSAAGEIGCLTGG